MARIGILFLILSLLLSLTSSGQDRSFDLKDMLVFAIENNYDQRILEKELEIGSASLSNRKGMFHPTVNAYLNYFWYVGNVPEYFFPENEGNILSGGASTGPYPVALGLPQNMFLGVRVEQPLFDYRFTMGKESEMVLNEIENTRLRIQKEETILSIGIAYYELLKLTSKDTLLQSGLERLERAKSIVSKQVENELASPLELDKINYELASAELSALELQEGIQLKKKQLKFLMGLSNVEDFQIRESEWDKKLAVVEMNEKVNANQTKLIQAGVALNDIRAKEARSERLPRLDFFADIAWQSQSENLGFFQDEAINNISNIGLRLDIPIYSGKSRKNNEKQLEKEKLGIQEEMATEAARLQQHKATNDLLSKTRRKQVHEKLANYSRRIFNRSEEYYEKGLISIDELLEARNEWIIAQSNLEALHYDIKIAELEYLKSNGNLLDFFNL